MENLKTYRDFDSVEELKKYYHIENVYESTEDKNDTDNDDEDQDLEDSDEKDNKGSQEINTDKIEVIYSNLKASPSNIFKNIIVFTNDKDPKSNKTLNNIYDAIKNLKKANALVPNLHVFTAANVNIEDDGYKITIHDKDSEMTISQESNLDTLIFSRLGVQGEDECEYAVEVLQDRGFLVLNPVKYSELACNKYESSILFQKGDIPQPNFTLMTYEILNDDKLYNEALKEIYPEWDSKNPDKNSELEFVLKILNGHGGTGVALIDGKKIFPILQLIFAINKDTNILIQKKEEAEGGDIRVHVLTLRDKQIILGAMKRVKIKGDFRSNVSLGAKAEKIKLTPEQEQIALKTALLSKLNWCAVDIMPLVKGSNPQIGDNVVLEINASPGTDGISEVLGVNFVNIILNELTDPNIFKLQDKTAGYSESVFIKFNDEVEKEFLAKLDTGNSTQASVLEVGEYTEKGNNIIFYIDNKEIKAEKKGISKAIVGEVIHKRPLITIKELSLGTRKLKDINISLVKNRKNKTTNMLLNRDVLSRLGYVVHPNNRFVLTKEIEKVKII